MLVMLPFKLSTIGSRTLNDATAPTWSIITNSTLSAFRNRLKTHLFRRSYPNIFTLLKVFVSQWL